MAKKRKKKAKGRKGKKVQPQNLPALGEKQLESGRFSEAIKTFRQLLKNDGDERWLHSLSQAYRGRIEQLTAKGMVKEALVIYTNMANSCPAEDHWLHINLLLGNGHYQQALEVFTTLDKSLSKKEHQAAEELFAALLLSGADQALEYLPDDSLLKKHYPHANLALKAYCQGDYASAESHLQNISFRSPYRNFRLALKGMLTFEENRNEAETFFAKIADSSPFFRLIIPYHQLSGPVNLPVKLSRTEKQIVQTLGGIDKSTSSFLDGIRSRQNEPSRLYSFLFSQGRFLGRHKLQNICLRILPHAPDRFPDYQRRFGSPAGFEFEQLMALTSEVEHDYWQAAEDWQSALKVLEQNKTPEDNLKIAILCRHCAKLLKRDPDGSDINRIETLLEKSIKYDPHDRDTYFMLFEMNNDNQNKQYKIINRALKEFPEDIEVLFTCIEAAIGRGAFKKASRLAADLLKIDPINNKARLLLINAHLEHGRKLACKGKLDLAHKECGSAVTYDRLNLGQGEIEICHGLISLLSGNKDKGLALYDEGIAKASNPLLGCFQASLEARLLQMPKKWLRFFDKNLRTATKAAPDNDTLVALTTRLQHCNGKKHLHLLEFRKIITPWLKKGLKLKLSQEEYLSLCSVFHRRRYFDLLETYGKEADRRWPGLPLITFYHLYGKSEGGEKQLSMDQLDQLSGAMHAAMKQGDPKTANLIDDFLGIYLNRVGPDRREFDRFADKIFGEFSDMLESGEVNEKDFARFCEETGLLDEFAGEMVDIFDDDEDDEIFKMPPQFSGKGSKKELPQKDKNTKKKANPKQLNLFE